MNSAAPRRLVRLLTAALPLLLAAGCMSTREEAMDRIQQKTYFTPVNFNGVARLPVTLHRVLLLPLAGGSVVPPETSTTLEEVFVAELQKTLRFEIVRLSREECLRRFGAPEFASVTALPHDLLATLGRSYDADAVLFVDLTAFRGYRPLQLGVRAKLATIQETRLLWSFDEVFSADDPAVGNSVRRFFGVSDPAGIPLDPGHGALQSPSKFAAYVAAATFATLPPR
jgi:hypothetical protein